MKSWNLIKFTLNLNQIKTVNLDKKEKRKMERECYYSLFYWWENYNKVTCTNSQAMIVLKMGHQNAFSVIHSMRLPVGEGLDSKYVRELWDSPLWGGRPSPLESGGLQENAGSFPGDYQPGFLFIKDTEDERGRRRAKQVGLGLSSISVLSVGFSFPWFSFL